MPKRRAVQAAETAAEPDIEQAAKRVRKAAAAEPAKPFPQPVLHPSHLKVAVSLQLLSAVSFDKQVDTQA